MECIDIKVDFDACEERWKYYQIRYRDFGISLEDVIFPGKDKSARGKWKFCSIVLSGDCFFSFIEKKVRSLLIKI